MSEELERYAPVLIPTLNRLHYLRRCIETLMKNKLAEKTNVIISLDYPPSQKYVEGYIEVCDYLAAGIDGFKSVVVLKQDHNLGLCGNGMFLQEYAKKRYDRYIYVEDDIEFAPNFLEYINKGLDIFENDDNIIAICGRGLVKKPLGNLGNIVLSTDFSAYGYGMWFRKQEWLTQKINRKNFEGLARNRAFVKELYQLDKSLFFALQSIITRSQKLYQTEDGEPPFVDMAVKIVMLAENKYVVVPVVWVSITRGYDGTGENCPKVPEWDRIPIPLDDKENFEYVFSEPLKIYKPENILNLESSIRYFVGKFKMFWFLFWHKNKGQM